MSIHTPTTPQPEVKPEAAPTTIHSPELARDLDRLRREEQERIDKEKQAELARQRELARFD